MTFLNINKKIVGSMGRKTLLVFSLRVTAAVILFVLNVVIAKQLGAKGAGEYFLTITIMTILSTICIWGMDQYGLKNISIYFSKAKYLSVSYFNKNTTLFISIISIICAVVLFISADFLANTVFSNNNLATSIKIVSLALPAYSISIYYAEILRAVNKTAQSMIIAGICIPVVALAVISLGTLFFSASADWAVMAYVIGSYICAMAAIIIWSKGNYGHKGNESVIKKDMLFNIKERIIAGYPFFNIAILYILLGWSDTIILGVFRGTEEVGIYGVVIRIAKLVTFALYSMNVVAAPMFASLYAEKNMKELQKVVSKATLIICMLCLPIIIIIFVIPEFVLSFFGEEFVSGASALRIMALGQLVNAVTGSVLYLLTMSGNEKRLRNFTIIITFSNIILNLIAIPLFGLIGAAVVSSLSIAAANIGAVWIAKKQLGIITLPFFRQKRDNNENSINR